MLGFIIPERLLYLALLIPSAMILLWAERLRHRRLLLLRAAAHSSKMRVILPVALMAIAILALARPYNGFHDVTIQSQGRDVVLAVDISYSMLATDISPSRLEVAKRKIFDLIDAARAQKLALRFSIVTFAGKAFRYCPLTNDFEIVRLFAESLSTEITTSHGSSLESAVNASLDALSQDHAPSGAVVLLSDGEDLEFNANTVEKMLKSSGVPFYTIGLGGTVGVPIPIGDGKYFRTTNGDVVLTKMNEDTLRSIAMMSGGAYHRADVAGHETDDIISALQLKGGSATATTKTVRSYQEIGPWIIAALVATLAIIIASGAQSVIFSVLLLSSLVGYSRPARADEEKVPSLRESYEAYENGDYALAEKGFSFQHNQNPQNNDVTQALASALYKQKKYEEAGKLFDSLTSSATTGRERYESEYNSGNSHLMSKEYQKAIDQYAAALKSKPNDIPATTNMAVAKKMLEQQQKQQSSQSSSHSSNSSNQNSNSSSSKNSSSDSHSSSDKDQQKSQSSTSNQNSSDLSKAGQSSSKESENPGSNGSTSDHSSAMNSNQAQSQGASSNSSASSGNGGASSKSSDSSQEQSQGVSEGQSSSEQRSVRPARPTPDPLQALDSLEDKPILPRQRNYAPDPESGQTW